MKCAECPDYADCHKKYNLTIKRRHCPKAKDIKVLTNSDRIRIMNAKDLATWILSLTLHNMRPWCDFHCRKDGRYGCENCVMKWLQQPVEV